MLYLITLKTFFDENYKTQNWSFWSWRNVDNFHMKDSKIGEIPRLIGTDFFEKYWRFYKLRWISSISWKE